MQQSKKYKNTLIISRLLPAFLFITVSCSMFKSDAKDKELRLNGYESLQENDFVDHFVSLKKSFLKSSDVKILRLNNKDTEYIRGLINTISSKNSNFFTKDNSSNVYIVQSETPFHFSLPEKNIFLSTGLFKKYIQNESLLLCVLTFELIRSEKNFYKKSIIIPTGVMSPKEILPLLRLSATQKMEIHKWSFRLLKKLEIDSDTYLSWLQIQNRNSIDFSMQLGDINKISREEALFKAFIIDNSRGEKKREYRSSTKSFYKFLRSVRNNG